MKAIFIDTHNKTVTDVDIKGDLNSWYKILNVRIVETAINIDETNSILVDEEGLFKPVDEFFAYKGGHQPFAGNGLVTGVDKKGETIGTTLTADDVREKITFMNRTEVIESLDKEE